jgi:hypothetical protein
MGRVRAWAFDAVIGVGGIGAEATSNGLKGKLTWIGIGAHKPANDKKPLVTFDRFLYLGQAGPSLRTIAPNIAARMYDRNTRATTDAEFLSVEREEVARILTTAGGLGPSLQKQSGTQDELRTKRCSVRRCRSVKER